MNKVFAIITGVLIGVGTSFVLILTNPIDTAYSQESGEWWNNFVADADRADFDWNAIFNSAGKGKDLYNLMYQKSNRQAEDQALKDVAASYGLTTNEVQAVLGGSLIPIFNNPNRRGGTLSQETAQQILKNVQDNYALLKEVYDIQQEVDLAIKPSEMFQNGDVSDSGFDLVHDLAIMEEILFFEKTPIVVGENYKEALPTPYNPVQRDATLENYLASGAELDNLAGGLTLESPTDETGGLLGKYKIGNEEKVVEVLDSDVCVVPDDLAESLDNFEKNETGGGGETGENTDDETGGQGTGNSGDVSGDGGGDDDGPGNTGEPAPKEPIQPAPAGDWKTKWCLGQDEDAPQGYPEVTSLGGIGDSYLEGSTNPGNGKAFSADISLCLDVKMIKQTIASYQPGTKCVLCELEKINEDLEKTLSHTLVPNKATGNLLESAKCKNAGTLFSMQFVTIWNPVPAPEEDIIFGKNIFEQWNKFVENYQPIWPGKLNITTENRPDQSENRLLQVQGSTTPSGVSQSELFDQVQNIRNKYAAEAVVNVQNLQIANTATNVSGYAEDIVSQMEEMNALFQNFGSVYIKLNENVLPEILQKETK